MTPPAPTPAPLGSALFFAVLLVWVAAFCAGAIGAFLLATMAGHAGDRQSGSGATLSSALYGAAIAWFVYALVVPFIAAVRVMRGKSGWLIMASPPALLGLALLALMAGG